MASQPSDDRYYIAADASEMNKIDETLRLTGLNFPMNRPVLGRKQAGLILALAAFEIKHKRAGKQLVVVRRLCVLYDALLNIHKDHPALDINGDTFYEAAIDSISKKHLGISKYLTSASLRHVIDLYRKAFHYGGVRPIKPDTKNTDDAQETAPAQYDAAHPDAAQPNDNGGETFIGENLTETSKPLDPIGDRVKLEKLVKEWMVVRAIARSNEGTGEEPETIDTHYPEKYPAESAESIKANMLHLKQESEEIRRERKQCGEDSNKLLGNNYRMLRNNHEMLKNNHEIIKLQNKVLSDSNGLLKSQCERQRQQIAEMERMHDTIAKENDKMDELARVLRMNDGRLASLRGQLEDHGSFPGGSGGSGGFPDS